MILKGGSASSRGVSPKKNDVTDSTDRGGENKEPAWHSVSLDQVVAHFNTHPLAGLTEAEASSRLLRFGSNELAEAPPKTFLARLAEQLGDFLVLILIVASVVSAAVGEIVDSLVIIGIVVLNAFLGIFQESKAEKSLERLRALSAPKATVVRDGRSRSVPASSLVPGDLVVLAAGDKVPADLRLLEAKTLKVDEAPLTGESFPVEKDAGALVHAGAPLGERSNSAFMGTAVVYGRGRGVVVRTGMKTAMGEVAEALSATRREKTPLQRDLAGLGKTLGIAFILISAVVFLLGLLRGMAPVDMFLTSVSLAVAAIPEGLPAVVTIVLAIGVSKMVEKHAVIRRLSAVETLGSTTVICSDKTGTITQNQMTAVAVLPGVSGGIVRVTGSGYEPKGEFLKGGDEGPTPFSPLRDPCLYLLLRACTLNNDASLVESERGRWDVVGDPTEGALLVLSKKAGLERDRLLESCPRTAEIPFDSERKRMTTIHRAPEPRSVDGAADDWIEEGYVAFVKGAPESLYGLIRWYLGPDGELLPFDENARRVVHEKGLEMAKEALRVMAFAYRHLDGLPSEVVPETVERDLTFIGLVGMIDPPRPEAVEAVKVCKRAGIIPVMITGDHPETAVAIAAEVGIYDRIRHKALSGGDLDNLSDDDLERVAYDTRVYARVSPGHKMRIVEALKRRGHVVAMTGDGVNDAPALKRADMGVAMGITGTDVAKETADMILTDDNFSSIVAAVEQGRIIYSNIRKFVYYLLSVNIGEIVTIFVAMVAGMPVPLKPVHLLWLNLVTDSFPALAIGMEKGDPDIMRRPPRKPGEPIITASRWVGIAVQSALIAVATLGVFWYTLHAAFGPVAAEICFPWADADWVPSAIARVIGSSGDVISDVAAMRIRARLETFPGLTYARTVTLTTLVSAELLRAFSARSDVYPIYRIGFTTNRYMLYAAATSFALMLLVMYTPALALLFSFVPLTGDDWLIVIPFAVIPAAGSEAVKMIRQWRKRVSPR